MCLPAIPALVAAGISGPMQAMIAITAALSAATSVGTAVSASNAQAVRMREPQKQPPELAHSRVLNWVPLCANPQRSPHGRS